MDKYIAPSDADASASGSESNSGPTRRSVVVAGALAIPAITLVSAAPAHASSPGWTLSWDSATVSIAAGDTSGNATATLRYQDGTGVPGQPVLVTLSSGFVFASGAAAGQSSATVVTDGSGQISITVKATGDQGSGSLTATHDSLPAASAAVTVVRELTLAPSSSSVTVGGTSGTFVAKTAFGGGNPPLAGRSVTITLPTGFAFASPSGAVNATSSTFTTDAAGTVSFTVKNTGSAASGVITASSPGFADATATINAATFLGWGYNLASNGQIATTFGFKTTPIPLSGGNQPAAITARGGSLAAVLWADQNGILWGRGYNIQGVVGTGVSSPGVTEATRSKSGPGVDFAKKVIHIARGTNQEASVVVAEDGTVWATGIEEGQGFATSSTGTNYVNTYYFKQVGQALPWNGATAKTVEINPWGNLAIVLSDGRVLITGYRKSFTAQGVADDFQMLSGAEMKTAANTPITGAVSAGVGWSSSAVVTSDGKLYTAGEAQYGGSGTNYLVQKPLPAGKTAKSVIVAQYSIAVLMTDGTVWALGGNLGSFLGVGDVIPGASFAQAGPFPTGTTVVDMVIGGAASLFLLSNGEVWFAGTNTTGGFGDGTTLGLSANPRKVSNLPVPVRSIATLFLDSFYAL